MDFTKCPIKLRNSPGSVGKSNDPGVRKQNKNFFSNYNLFIETLRNKRVVCIYVNIIVNM